MVCTVTIIKPMISVQMTFLALSLLLLLLLLLQLPLLWRVLLNWIHICYYKLPCSSIESEIRPPLWVTGPVSWIDGEAEAEEGRDNIPRV